MAVLHLISSSKRCKLLCLNETLSKRLSVYHKELTTPVSRAHAHTLNTVLILNIKDISEVGS